MLDTCFVWTGSAKSGAPSEEQAIRFPVLLSGLCLGRLSVALDDIAFLAENL